MTEKKAVGVESARDAEFRINTGCKPSQPDSDGYIVGPKKSHRLKSVMHVAKSHHGSEGKL